MVKKNASALESILRNLSTAGSSENPWLSKTRASRITQPRAQISLALPRRQPSTVYRHVHWCSQVPFRLRRLPVVFECGYSKVQKLEFAFMLDNIRWLNIFVNELSGRFGVNNFKCTRNANDLLVGNL